MTLGPPPQRFAAAFPVLPRRQRLAHLRTWVLCAAPLFLQGWAAMARAQDATAAAPEVFQATTPTPQSSASTPATIAPSNTDSVPVPSYIPGYRRAPALSLSPYAPQVGEFPGGTLLPYTPSTTSTPEWTFKWNGFLTASLQTTTNKRPAPEPGQSTTVFHVPPQSIDEYASFVGTSTLPGNWAALNFDFGNSDVRAYLSLNTWNPGNPSTYYQIGTQYFINNAFITWKIPPIGNVRLHGTFGYLYNFYGSLGEYGLGMYQNAVLGSARGIGGTLRGEYPLGSSYTLVVEGGVMGNRDGRVPSLVIANGDNGSANPALPSSWIRHLHVGVARKGDRMIRAGLHYLVNWSQDDRNGALADDPTTHAVDESKLKDGKIAVYGGDVSVNDPIYGYLGAAAAYVKGHDAFLLRGLSTFGGEGDNLTKRWWGEVNGGTGTLMVAALNYTVSLGKIVAQPRSFYGDGPDILIGAGVAVAKSTTDFETYDRVRHKYGLDVMYKFLPYVSAGIRGDRVVPTSRDSGETFHVIAPRLVFKSDWQSRENVTLTYAKWFYGPRSHPEASVSMAPDRIDDQLLALNVNMWW